MDPETRKFRRRMVFGAIFVPVILLLCLGASLIMHPASWMATSFLVGCLAVIGELARTRPGTVRSGNNSRRFEPADWKDRVFHVILIISIQFIGQSERVKTLLNDLTSNGLDLPLMVGVGLILLGWIVLRLGKVREVTDQELHQFLEWKAAEDLEKRHRSREPVEY